LELIPSDARLKGNAHLGAAALLFEHPNSDLRHHGQVELQRIAYGGETKDLRIVAMRLLGASKEIELVSYVLTKILGEDSDEAIRLEAARAMLRLEEGKNNRMKHELEALLTSSRRDIQERAALALAEIDDFRRGVGPILRGLSQEPTERGRLASRLLKRPPPTASGPASALLTQRVRSLERENRRLRHRLEAGPGAPSGRLAVFAEVLDQIHKRGLYGRTAAEEELLRAGLEAMISSVDLYGRVLFEADIARVEGRAKATTWGLGVRLLAKTPETSPIVAGVTTGSPARQSGLLTGDRILEINGAPTAGAAESELRSFFAPRESREIRLRCESWGSAPRELTIAGAVLEDPSLVYNAFPHGVGYIRLPRFVPNTTGEISQAIRALTVEGTHVLLLDLRDNPGGDLEPALRTVDLFVGEKEDPILTQVFAGGRSVWTQAQPEPLTDVPLVVLVNRFTASAAEVVTAALQDFGRALVIGEPTYGKGLRQVLIHGLPESRSYFGERCALLLTDSRLYRSAGGSLEEGVQPDIRAGDPEALGIADFDELERVMYSPQVYDYFSRHRAAVQEALGVGDIWTPSEYPELDSLKQELKTTLGAEALAYALRRVQRQRLTEERGIPPWARESGDAALHVAIREALKKIGKDPAPLPEYRHVSEG
jgi:carboxyl-terminal processing protease